MENTDQGKKLDQFNENFEKMPDHLKKKFLANQQK